MGKNRFTCRTGYDLDHDLDYRSRSRPRSTIDRDLDHDLNLLDINVPLRDVVQDLCNTDSTQETCRTATDGTLRSPPKECPSHGGKQGQEEKQGGIIRLFAEITVHLAP